VGVGSIEVEIEVGRVAVGRVAVGRVEVGRVAVGRVAVGRVAVGRVAVGRVAIAVGRVAVGVLMGVILCWRSGRWGVRRLVDKGEWNTSGTGAVGRGTEVAGIGVVGVSVIEMGGKDTVADVKGWVEAFEMGEMWRMIASGVVFRSPLVLLWISLSLIVFGFPFCCCCCCWVTPSGEKMDPSEGESVCDNVGISTCPLHKLLLVEVGIVVILLGEHVVKRVGVSPPVVVWSENGEMSSVLMVVLRVLLVVVVVVVLFVLFLCFLLLERGPWDI
jgi:hypothetical protein